jgi:uncharacterized protein (TIRG00374 family)
MAVFALMLWRIGPGTVWSELRRLSLRSLAFLFGLRTAYWVFRTWIWRTIYARYGSPPAFGHLFGARIAGHAVSYLTPSAYVGGEAVRALMIEGHDRKKALASVVVDTTFEILAVLFLGAFGTAVAVARSSLAFPARVALVSSFAAAVLLLGLIIRKQRQGFFAWLIAIPARLGIFKSWIERNRGRVRRVDDHIAGFYAGGGRAPLMVFGLDMVLNAFWILEIYVTLSALRAPGLTLVQPILVATFGAAGLVLPLSPASFGTYEATNLAVFAGLGWSAGLALSLTIIRRAIALFWAGVGLLVIARKHVRLRRVEEDEIEGEAA